MSSINVDGKDYVLLEFKRQGDDWLEATASEHGAPQDELKKIAKRKGGHALSQLEKMGAARRQQIQEVAAEFSAQEPKDVFWEPLVIQNTDERKNREGKLSVKAFKVIFARRARPANPIPSQPVKVSKPPKVKQPDPPKSKEDKPADKTKPEEKPKTFQRRNTLNDPFNSVPLFSNIGEPLDQRGPVSFANPTVSPFPTEKPLAYRIPPPANNAAKDARKPQPQLDPFVQGALGGIPGFDDILDGQVLPGRPDEIVDLETEPVDSRERPNSRHKHHSTSRRRSSALRDGGQPFRSPTRFSDHYHSSRSSWASGDESPVVGDWDDLSSRTSDETDHSLPPTPLRTTFRRYHPQKKYYRDSRLQPLDRLIVEDSRRHRQPAIEARRASPAFEEARHTKPVVHQQARPVSRQSIPPEAVYPSHFEDSREEWVEDYMRDRQQEARGYPPKRYSFDPRDYRRNQRPPY